MDIKQYLAEKEIEFKIFTHPAVYTCEEADKYNKDIRGVHSKNLFLKERKGRRFYLVILPAEQRLDMNSLGEKLNEKLKFANEADLNEILGITTGAVSPFALINDKEGKVEAVISGQVGPNAYEVLKQGEVKIFIAPQGSSVREAIDKWKHDKLQQMAMKVF